jgi:hypothetical protein
MARSKPSRAPYQLEVTGAGAPTGNANTPPGRSSLMSVGELEDLGPATYGELFRQAITDLLEPPDIPAAGRALPVRKQLR